MEQTLKKSTLHFRQKRVWVPMALAIVINLVCYANEKAREHEERVPAYASFTPNDTLPVATGEAEVAQASAVEIADKQPTPVVEKTDSLPPASFEDPSSWNPPPLPAKEVPAADYGYSAGPVPTKRSQAPKEVVVEKQPTIAEQYRQVLAIDDSARAARSQEEAGEERKAAFPLDPREDSTFKPEKVVVADAPLSGETKTAIEVEITESGKYLIGDRIPLKLLQPIKVGPTRIERGTVFYGVVTGFQPQRVNITVTQILKDNRQLSVKLQALDSDGYLGVFISGGKFKEFSKEVGTQATNGMSYTIMGASGNAVVNGAAAGVANVLSGKMSNSMYNNKAKLKAGKKLLLIQGNEYW